MSLFVHSKSSSAVLLADSGSTKTDWCIVVDGKPVFQCQTSGLNPALQPIEIIKEVLTNGLLGEYRKQSCCHSFPENLVVRFYGAGCRGVSTVVMREALAESLSLSVDNINVESDLMAAAHALCCNSEGIACILGTGSNSCLYDGESIIANVPALGYILGDEGSGAVLGKRFVNSLFKGSLPDSIKREFVDSTGMDLDAVIRRVYKEPMANRFLASISLFIYAHIECPQVESIVIKNFVDFFDKNISHYQRPDLSVNAVGSVASYYLPQLRQAASECGYRLGEVLRSPMQGLIASCGE